MSTTAKLTSTTAPGKIFGSRAELAEHYKSDWHKYNLKRREGNMPMLTQEEFNARLEAALALRKEREGREARSGTDHLKDKSSSSDKKKLRKNNSETKRISKRQLRQQERNVGFASPAQSTDEPVGTDDMQEDIHEEDVEMKEQEAPEIDPKQSLFDKHVSPDVKCNIEYMYNKFGFFIPDKEFLIDEEGLIGYCAEKIKLGHTCLYCQKIFRTWRGCQEHMLSSSHAKIRYEAGIDLEEFDVFYDFTADNEEFMKSGLGNHRRNRGSVERRHFGENEEYIESIEVEQGDSAMGDDDEEEEEWEDVDSDEEMADDDEGIYASYQDEIARHGFDITPLGELIFPDGRIVGHRGLSRYYKQRFAPEDNRTSVLSARRAYGERLLNGRVYDTYAMRTEDGQASSASRNATALQLARVGLCIGAAQGRAGKGILIPSGGGSGAMNSFTALSLYRYKAAVKKARREEFRGRRLEQRTSLAMNKMDKKGNRLMNNVSVAHASR